MMHAARGLELGWHLQERGLILATDLSARPLSRAVLQREHVLAGVKRFVQE